MFVSNKVFFLEKEFLGEGTSATKIELDEICLVKESTQTSKSIKLNLIRSNSEPIVEAPVRRFGRVLHQPDRYHDFLIRDGDPVELDENNEDPITYIDAIQRSNFNK